LAVREDGCVLYHLRRPWPHPQGATCLVLEPLDFMRRLAALVPAPYAHTVRYHGCFANRARSRQHLPAPPVRPATQDSPQTADTAALGAAHQDPADTPTPARRRTPLPWAQLLRRVFFLDALKCPKCSTALVVLAFISDPPVVTKILRHLRMPTTPPPLAPARASTTAQLWGLDPPRHADPDDPAGEALDLSHPPRPCAERDHDPDDAPLVARPPP
jgi:hypothetical protein